MKYKALITDFDFTLANANLEISEIVKAAIKQLVKKNIYVSIATGRPYYGIIKTVVQELQLTAPQINCGGAMIVDPNTGKIIWKEFIPAEVAKDLVGYLKSRKIYIALETSEAIFTSDGKELKSYPCLNYKHIKDLQIKEEIPKILISAWAMRYTKEHALTIEKDLNNRYKNLHITKISIPVGFGFDITSIKATKHLAVLEYLKLTRLKREAVVGVGDGYNDYPLLIACGARVAMGNAPQELKDIADFVAPPQNQNGILAVIEKYF
ncbi:hypothetical protein A3F03_02690 [Candidatus Roizmanbacteria bacterium RIFCSPHIGHO2_12_FULL_41_11]|uniref:Haloacid dehalogenase n=1 Tax=Candidatus Roizmanbacteria bacterium RIFCSPHIGHO2_12_FULL_41_11 TaxID=1802052 RepID=A0A1F7I5R6_9BACT|nr:MAG: hypothetical protein A3F03_02690 [Candidatus Roizmanbacteria bacterium RIFCSPHIGHO2_12_FULL_41_11]